VEVRGIKVVAAAFVVFAIVCSASVGTAAAAPSCTHWQVNSHFSADQGNGITVTFMLHQAGKHLGGTASFTETHPEKNEFGQSTASTTYGDVVASSSQLASGKFTVHVHWTNGADETYSGTLWFVKHTATGGLYANLNGKTNVAGAIALVNWHTHSGTHGVKPVTCLAKNTVGT
jgi:hypothetical protein